MSAAEQILQVAAGLPPRDPLRVAVEQGDEDPVARMARLERDLTSGRLPVFVAGQIPGYWYAPHDEVSATPPEWMPTGAVLLPGGASLGADTTALDLVSIDYVWFPLSIAGTYTYPHSAGLRRGEEWRFVLAGAPWPTVYLASMVEPLGPPDIEHRYGIEAARRARTDQPAVQLRLHREAH